MRAAVLVSIALSACWAGTHDARAPGSETSESDPVDDPEQPDDLIPAATPTKTGGGEALLAEAQRELASMRETHYAHHTVVDEAHGTFDYDCSGFVGYALARSAPAAWRAIQDATRPRPLARDFEAALTTGLGPWSVVPRARDLQPGDVIAWLEPPAKRSRNTGHVMIVSRAPTQGRQPAGQLVVGVIDSSHSGHGRGDRRTQDGTGGLGTGDLVLLVDVAGHAVGYRWSTGRRSVHTSRRSRSVASRAERLRQPQRGRQPPSMASTSSARSWPQIRRPSTT